ncbi:MAG: hypothetical protein AB1414_12900 [bacterium]
MILSEEKKQEIIEEEFLKRSVRDPGVAAVLSFCFNGLGQMYNGQIRKGINIMASSVLLMICVVITTIYLVYIFWLNPQQIVQLILWLILLALSITAVAILGIYSIYDAYNGAKIKK